MEKENMTELSYLGIVPSKRIAEMIEVEDPQYQSLKKLVTAARAYIGVMENENLKHLEKRAGEPISSSETLQFLRCQERTRNARLILQYLLTFIGHLPSPEENTANPAHPFEQLKSFSIYSVELLKQKDVVEAILTEHESLGLLTETNNWYYRGQIDKSYKTLRAMLEKATQVTVKGYRQIFLGLQQLSSFWFSVRNQEVQRVRKSDILTYKFTRYLLAKYK